MQGTLAVPGACQWMRIDQGTWTVTNLSAPTLVMRAFLVRDVSEPLAFFRGDEVLQSVRKTRDEVQVALEEPFLVQMCWQEPTRTGLYRVRVSPNVGADPEHPVVLPLNRPVPLSFGNQFGANPTTKLWTVAVVPKTFSGDGHKLRLDLGDHASTKLRAGTGFEMRVRRPRCRASRSMRRCVASTASRGPSIAWRTSRRSRCPQSGGW